MYTFEELQSQMPDAIHIYVGCTQADCDAMPVDFYRVGDGDGNYAVGTSAPRDALASKEIFPTAV